MFISLNLTRNASVQVVSSIVEGASVQVVNCGCKCNVLFCSVADDLTRVRLKNNSADYINANFVNVS